MAKPTLLIGIGTSGLMVLEETQKFYFEHTGKNKPGNVEYIYLETDEDKYPSTTVLKNEIKRVYLDLSDKNTKINNLKDRLPDAENTWVPNPDFIKDAGKGAAGMPAFGRAALWSYPNFDNVKDAIRSSFNRINSHTQQDSDNSRPAVFITGSITGGTGSGVFVDLAYMVKNQIPGLEEVYGLFLTPGRNYMGRDNILYCNTLSSLAALEKYNKAEQTYTMNWPDSTQAKLNVLPFEMAHFISQDRNDGATQVKTLSGLYKIAGLWMFLNIFGLREKRNTRLTDGKGSAFIDKYGSFGIGAVQYPKRQLEELLGIDLSINLLERWTDPLAYYNNGDRTLIQSIRQKIISDTQNSFEQFLSSAFKILDATIVDGDNRIINDLAVKAEQINKREFNETSEYHFIKRWFSSNGDHNYYTAVKNNLKSAEDELIQRIQELISSTLNRTENLQIAKLQLSAIVHYIDSNINYWRNLNISPKPEKWENLLEEQIRWILKRRYKFLGEQDAVVYDRLKNSFELMKIHLMGERILAIKKNISDSTDALRTFNGNITLPKINHIDDLIRRINNVINHIDRGSGEDQVKLKTLKSRFNDIEAELKDETIPILRIYPDGSSEEAYERSLESAKATYARETGKNIPSKSTIIGEEPLWDYINTPPEQLHRNLFSDCIGKFQSDVIQHSCFGEMDIAEFIHKNPKASGKMAAIAKTPLIMVNNDNRTDFVEGKGIPRLVIGKDKNQMDSIFQSLRSETESAYLNSYKEDEDGTWLNEEIDNIVIFYVEQGYMSTGDTFNPIKHLRYIEDIKRVYKEETQRYIKTRDVKKEVWHNLRCPYLDEAEMNTLVENKADTNPKEESI